MNLTGRLRRHKVTPQSFALRRHAAGVSIATAWLVAALALADLEHTRAQSPPSNGQPVPAQSAPAQSAPAQSAPAPSVPTQPQPAQPEPAQPEPAQPFFFRLFPFAPGQVQPNQGQAGRVQPLAEATLPASQLRYAGFSPDGKEVRVGTNQGKFQRLTATKLALIGQAESVPPFGVASAAVTRDHTLLAVGSWRGDILLSDSQTDEIKVQLPVQFDLDQTAVTAIVLAEDARKCVVGNRSSKVRMYRVDPPELVWESAPLDQEISGVDLSGDGAHVVVSTGVLNDYRSPGKIVALDAANGKVRHSWTDTTSKVNHVAIAGDSRSLLAADNAALRVYDLVTGQLLHTHPALSGVQRIKFIDATHCAISLFPGRLAIWHLPSKRVVLHYTGHKPGADRTIAQLIWALDVSPDKQKLLSADTTGQVYLWPIPAKLLAPTP